MKLLAAKIVKKACGLSYCSVDRELYVGRDTVDPWQTSKVSNNE